MDLMTNITQLHSFHVSRAKMTEFAGYDMPLWYTTTSEEHLAVRNSSGIFDVSHMGRFVLKGESASKVVERLVPTTVERQDPGRATYTLLLNERGGIIDDLIVMKVSESEYILVVNAANSEVDLKHIEEEATGVEVIDTTSKTAMIALQGPVASSGLQPLVSCDLSSLGRFRFVKAEVAGEPSIISRTGYTGEDGFEIIVEETTIDNPAPALRVWGALAGSSSPCGLGSRDSLRLEAGFPLHGQDMDQNTDPFKADLGWVLSKGKSDYVGWESIRDLGSVAPSTVRRGMVMDHGVPRHGFDICLPGGEPIGIVTSGTFSPLSRKGIALCLVKASSSSYGTNVAVRVRGAEETARITKPPFYDSSHYGWKRIAQP